MKDRRQDTRFRNRAHRPVPRTPTIRAFSGGGGAATDGT